MKTLSAAELDERVVPDHELTTPECHRLWRQVLEQAVRDALDPRDVDRGDDLTDAVVWLRPENPDYIIVAERAGLDPQAFYERFRKFQLDAKPLRGVGWGA